MRKELLLVSGLLVSSMAFAIDPVEIDSLINLKGVVVSANKIHVNRNSVPLSISVIERVCVLQRCFRTFKIRRCDRNDRRSGN